MKTRIDSLGICSSSAEGAHRLILEVVATYADRAACDRDHAALKAIRERREVLEVPIPLYVDTRALAERGRGLAVIESPFLGGAPWALLYARLALREQLALGRTPFASHLLYPQALDDADPNQRDQGLSAGWAPYGWGATAEVYVDFGITLGMAQGIEEAMRLGRRVVYRGFGPAVRDHVTRMAATGSANPAALVCKDDRSIEVDWPGAAIIAYPGAA